MLSPVTRQCRQRCGFNFEAKRRREIEHHAILVGAPKTEDFERWLIAWYWHNSAAADPVWSLTEAAKRMGGEISEAEAAEIAQQAATYPKRLKADALGMWLGVNYVQREALRLTTIGARDVKKRARKELRKRKDMLYQQRKRRERGARPQAQSLSQTKPWEAMGISRASWYRRKDNIFETTSSAPLLVSRDDESVSPLRLPPNGDGIPLLTLDSGAIMSSRTATLIRADSRPFQAVPRPPDYDPVAAARDRMAARQSRGWQP